MTTRRGITARVTLTGRDHTTPAPRLTPAQQDRAYLYQRTPDAIPYGRLFRDAVVCGLALVAAFVCLLILWSFTR